MQVRSLVLADSVGLTPDGKALIVGGGIGRVTVRSFPWALAQIGAFISLEPDSETPGSRHSLEIEVVEPSGAVLGNASGVFEIPPPSDQGLTLINFAPMFFQLQLRQEGQHRVDVRADSHVIGSYPFSVSVEDRSQTAAHWYSATTGG